jgi:hypothetical protein
VNNRHHLAAGDAGLVGDHALDVLDPPRRQPSARLVQRSDATRLFNRLFGALRPCHVSPVVHHETADSHGFPARSRSKYRDRQIVLTVAAARKRAAARGRC